MSRTDVHRPWRVQVADPYSRHLFYRYAVWPWQMGVTSIVSLCGCKMCTGQPGRKLARKQERVQWRSVRQELLAGGRDGYDVPAIRGNAW